VKEKEISIDEYIFRKGSVVATGLKGPEAQVRAAQMKVVMGEWDEALKLYQEAWVDLYKHRDEYVWQGLYCRVGVAFAMLLEHKNKLNEAEDVFNAVMEISPGAEVLGAYAVFLHRKRKNYDLSERYFQESLKQVPTQSSVHLKYAGFLRHVRKNFVAAEHHYQKAIEENPDNIDALGTYASYLHGLGDKQGLAKAEELYQKCFETDPCHPNNCCNFGLFLSEEKGDYIRAAKMYEAALSVSSEHANTLYNYGVMLDSHLGEKEQAEGMYRRALKSHPNHPFALYNLAVILEDKMLSYPKDDVKVIDAREIAKGEAEGLFAQAAAVSPNDATTLADHGRFLLTYTDRKADGIKQLQAALRLDETCATALYHLALVANERHKFADAHAHLRTLRACHPKHLQGLKLLVAVLQDDRYMRADKLSPKDALDELMLLYESILVLAKSQAQTDTSDEVLRYTTLVEGKGDATQKLRAINFLDRVSNQPTRAKQSLEAVLAAQAANANGMDDEDNDPETV